MKSLVSHMQAVRSKDPRGNVDESIYGEMPDAEVQLTARGRAQAVAAGRRLRQLLPRETERAGHGWAQTGVRG